MIRVTRQVLFLTIVLACCSAGAEEYSRNAEFPPVRFTLDQAGELANDIFRYVQNVNGAEKVTRGNVEFNSFKYDATFDLPMTPDDVKKSPDKVFSFKITLRSSDNKINRVILSLQDRTRYLNVSGYSYDHVTGLVSVVNDKMEKYHILFGGSVFRMILWIIFVVIMALGYGIITWRFRSGKVYAVALFIMAVSPTAIMWIFPWDRIFPGTLVTRGEVGLLEKYAALFTFLSFLLTIAGIVWQAVILRAGKREKGT